MITIRETSTVQTDCRDKSAGADPLDRFAYTLELQWRLCDLLETIADGLPNECDKFTCHRARHGLCHDIPVHQHLQETVVFPILERRAQVEDNVGTLLQQLRLEHAVDECFAGEVCELLTALSAGNVPENPDAAGYMLRGFFESYRRHVMWERNIIVPLARRRLLPEDLKTLSDALAAVPEASARPASCARPLT